MSNTLGFIFRFILKLVFGLSAVVVAVGLLLIALMLVTVSLLKSLVTGRRPAPAMAFARFQQFSQRRTWSGNRTFQDKPRAASGQVVDVEAHEVKDSGRQP